MAISLRNALLDFIAALRTAGVRISVAESLDAMNAVVAAGIERARMREALRAALIKDEADNEAFEAVFAASFGGARPSPGALRQSRGAMRGVSGSAGSSGGGPPPLDPLRTRPAADPARSAPAGPPPDHPGESSESQSGLGRLADQPLRPAGPPDGRPGRAAAGDAARDHPARAPSESVEKPAGEMPAGFSTAAASGGEAGRRAANDRAIERTPFAAYSGLEYEQARGLLAAIKRRLRVRLGRRLRIAHAGRLDFRRTLRAAIQRGGALADLRFRARRPRHIDLLILADLSGSVKYASTLMLDLMAGAYGCFRRVRSMVYVDRMAEAGFEHGHLVMTPALDLYARSDFGRVLADLWDQRAALLSRATVVVIMGDARNNRRPARADLLRQISQRCRTVIWLNPEPPERWNTGDSAIAQYARAVGTVLPCGNLGELERALSRVA